MPKAKLPAPLFVCPTPQNIEPKNLLLDARNPRLIQYFPNGEATQEELVKLLWQRLDVAEVAMSIAAGGFWKIEPLFAVVENGKTIVIEGNRRLTAIKVITDSKLRSKLRATDVPALADMSPEAQKTLETVPVAIVKKREDAWRILGFKHVNGPARWSSYAKAQYIAFVHDTTKTSLEDIASQIGDGHRTVQRLFRALKVLEQAERLAVYNRTFCYGGRLHFSHLMTALDYEGFSTFLGLRDKGDEASDPVDPKKKMELGEVCRWLFGDSRTRTPSIVENDDTDIRILDAIVQNDLSTSVLRRGFTLTLAFEAGKCDGVRFHEALKGAKALLVKAKACVTTGFEAEVSLLSLASSIAEMAYDLSEILREHSRIAIFKRKPPRAFRRGRRVLRA